MNKKNVILTFITIISFIIALMLAYSRVEGILIKNEFQKSLLSFTSKNQETIFSIDKITFFSSCDAKNKSASNSNFTIENLYQYTDIAFFITSPKEEKTMENTLKEVYIDNFKFEEQPSLGQPQLYFKNINNFAKSDINENNLIDNRLDYEITSEDNADLSTPVLYNNLANPIVLSYINSNIKSDYTLLDTSNPVTYDGSLLKRCNVLLTNISSKFSFDVYIKNNLDQEFKATVFITIPLEVGEQTIYDGSITLKQDSNIIFYRYN